MVCFSIAPAQNQCSARPLEFYSVRKEHCGRVSILSMDPVRLWKDDDRVKSSGGGSARAEPACW